MRVAFQGEPGAYSEAAALAHFGAGAHTIPHETFDAVFAAVESGLCDTGLVPVENSVAGSIHRNYDLFIQHKLCIIGEHLLRVRHCLVVLPGVDLSQIRKVISHPQALAQCERYLKSLTHVKAEVAYDTAGSVKIIKEQGNPTVAAIASRRAAEVYSLAILAEGIEDDPANFTRFLAIAPQPVTPEGDAKTSIVFTLHNQPGALFKALSVFALRDLDLTKIESRPLVGKVWEYLFYVDFAGSTSDASVRRALDHLGEYTPMLRVLGSYPRHRL
ncbi:MAG: prephenate dehydratase [Anaerolineales bacterium]